MPIEKITPKKADTPQDLEAEPPDNFCCKLTGIIMQNPVTDPYGDTYEEWAILKVLEKRQESPINRLPLKREELKSNAELKKKISDWQAGRHAD